MENRVYQCAEEASCVRMTHRATTRAAYYDTPSRPAKMMDAMPGRYHPDWSICAIILLSRQISLVVAEIYSDGHC